MDELQEEFEKRYKKTFPEANFGETHISMPCTCEDGGGPVHWAAVINKLKSIEQHFSHENTLFELRKDT